MATCRRGQSSQLASRLIAIIIASRSGLIAISRKEGAPGETLVTSRCSPDLPSSSLQFSSQITIMQTSASPHQCIQCTSHVLQELQYLLVKEVTTAHFNIQCSSESLNYIFLHQFKICINNVKLLTIKLCQVCFTLCCNYITLVLM